LPTSATCKMCDTQYGSGSKERLQIEQALKLLQVQPSTSETSVFKTWEFTTVVRLQVACMYRVKILLKTWYTTIEYLTNLPPTQVLTVYKKNCPGWDKKWIVMTLHFNLIREESSSFGHWFLTNGKKYLLSACDFVWLKKYHPIKEEGLQLEAPWDVEVHKKLKIQGYMKQRGHQVTVLACARTHTHTPHSAA
jgi:hypothetical protein